MKKFLKFFSIFLFSVLFLSSCFGGNPSSDESVTKLPGENANFVFKIDAKNADFLINQYKKLIPDNEENMSEKDKAQNKKIRELLEKFKNSKVAFSSLSGLNMGTSSISQIKDPTGILVSNLDSEIVNFMKDFKEGVKGDSDPKAKTLQEILISNKGLSEILKSGKEAGSVFKNNLASGSEEEKKRIIKIVEDIKLGKNDISVLIPATDDKKKLTGFVKDNKGYNELAKNLKGKEIFYIYGSGEAVKSVSSSAKVPSKLEIESILVSLTVEKNGVFVNLYSKTKSDITKEEDEASKKQAEDMKEKIKQYANNYSGFLLNSLEDEADKKVITDAIEGLDVGYKKLSNNIFNIKMSLNGDIEKIIDIFAKLYKKK